MQNAIGKAVRRKRLQNELTLRQLAKKIETSHGYIGDIEAGRVNPSVKTLVKLAKELDFSLDEIFLPKKYRNNVQNKDSA